MKLKTRQDVEQFLFLQKKTIHELRAICEGLKLSTKGEKSDLINKLANVEASQQLDPTLPQAIPLRSRDERGNLLPQADNIFKKWRKLIFDSKSNFKDFLLLNSNGKQYKQQMKYLPCTSEIATRLLQNRWYYPHAAQEEIVSLIQYKPENYNFSIVRRHRKSGDSFLMLHCEPRKIA